MCTVKQGPKYNFQVALLQDSKSSYKLKTFFPKRVI